MVWLNMNSQYPQTVVECLDPSRKYKPAVLRAVRAFGRAKPWTGTIAERQAKFRELNVALSAAYGVEPPKLVFGSNPERDSGSSCYIPALNAIILHGYSVVSYLHEFAHFLFGRSERKACAWSLNLFRRCFPRSWTRLRFEGHMVRAERREA